MEIHCKCKNSCGDISEADDHPQAICKITLGISVPAPPKTREQRLEEKLRDKEDELEKLKKINRDNEPRDFSYFGLGDGPT